MTEETNKDEEFTPGATEMLAKFNRDMKESMLMLGVSPEAEDPEAEFLKLDADERQLWLAGMVMQQAEYMRDLLVALSRGEQLVRNAQKQMEEMATKEALARVQISGEPN